MGDESLKSFDAEPELADGELSFASQITATETVDLIGFGVFRAVDDAEVFTATAFDAGLGQSFGAACDEGDRFADRPFTPGGGELLPPGDCSGLAGAVGDVDRLTIGGLEPFGVGGVELVAELEIKARAEAIASDRFDP